MRSTSPASEVATIIRNPCVGLQIGHKMAKLLARGDVVNQAFWRALDEMVSAHAVVLDRPAGSAHPRFPDLIYPFDYGYLEGTSAMDGGGIDVWRGSLANQAVTAIVLTVDRRKKDAEMKLLLGCTSEEMAIIERHHNGSFQSAILIPRESVRP